MRTLLRMIPRRRLIPLLARLLTNAHPVIRKTAVIALWKLGWAYKTREQGIFGYVAGEQSCAAIGCLVKAPVAVREHVRKTVDRFRWAQETFEQRTSCLVIRQAWDELLGIGAQSIPLLLTVFAKSDREMQQAIVKAWGAKGMPHTDVLVEAIQSDALRESAAILLGIARDPATVEPLTGLLYNKSSSVRETAAYALGLIGDTSAIEALQVCWRDTDVQHFSLRRAARWAVHRIDPSKSPGPEPGPVWLPWFHEVWVPKSWSKPALQ